MHSTSPSAARVAPTLPTLLQLAWPLVISRASQVVIGVSDALMVAHLGLSAKAATTTGALNAIAVFILPMGTVFIVSSFSSQLFGKGDTVGARRFGFYGLGVAVVTQCVCCALVFLGIGPILRALPFDPDLARLMEDYLFWRLLSGGAAVGIEALGNYYGGLGNTRLPMLINVLAMALNVVGNWILISGRLGAPALGVAGAALASSLSTWIAFLAVLARFLLEGRAPGSMIPKLHLEEMLRLLRFGIPSGFNWFFEFFAFNAFINFVVGGLGKTPLAAMNDVITINSASFMPAFGIASAGAILVGQAIGAGEKDDVPRILRMTFLTVATWQAVVGLAYVAAPALLLWGFVPPPPEDAEFLRIGVPMLMLSAAWQLFDSAATTVVETLRAAGDTTFTLLARIVLGWCVWVPGSYYTVHVLGWGDLGAVGWLIFYLALLAGVLYLRFRSGAWRRIRLTDPLGSTDPGDMEPVITAGEQDRVAVP
jgi:multidrug resistance protein, MATE family